MLDRKTIEKLGGWEGYRVERIAWPEDGSRTVTICLKPSARTMYCEHCGSRCRQIHETTVRRVRDLPLMALQVRLVVPRRRVWCEQCGGPRLEKLSWLGRYQRVTDRLAEAVSQLLKSSTIVAVARFSSWAGTRSRRWTRPGCGRPFRSPTGARSTIWRWMSSPCIRAIAMSPWWSIRSVARSCGSATAAPARPCGLSSSNSLPALPRRSGPWPST